MIKKNYLDVYKKYEFDLQKIREELGLEKLKIFDSFCGIGALHQSFKEFGFPIELIGVSEVDVDVIISYAIGHVKGYLESENTFNYPSEPEMREYLMNINVGWDFKKKKSSIPRLKKDKLYKCYRACIMMNNLGDISTLDPNEIEDFDMFNFSFPCFLPGTLILTKDGYKNIEDIKENDYVLTHTNSYKRVVKPMSNYVDGSIYKIKTMCATDTYVTGNHPFYVRERYKEWNNDMRRYVRKFKKPEWVEAKKLSKDYYVGVAINKASEYPNWDGVEINSTWAKYGHKKKLNNINKYFNNEDFWWIVGRYIGDGYVQSNIDYKNTKIYNLYITCAKEELHEVTDVLDRLNIINNDFKYKYYDGRSVYKIRIANVEFAIFLQQFGKYAKNKHLTGTILNLPKKELKGFLDGYMSADGCFSQNLRKASTISHRLIYDIAQCEAKVYNMPYSIYFAKRKKTTVIEGRLVNQNDSYSIVWKDNVKKQDKAFYEDGYIWCPINGVEKVDYDGLVYNMEVEEDNSYVANGIIVHNCTNISVSGKQEGFKDEDGKITSSGLYVYGINVIKAKKPKFIMIENVKNLIQKKFINDFYDIVKEIEELGYKCYYPIGKDKPTCLNAKDYGIPQNRERIFVICIRNDIPINLEFPKGFDSGLRLKDILEEQVDEIFYLSQEIQNRFKRNNSKDVMSNKVNTVGTTAPEFRTIGQRDIVYGINGVMGTLVATDYKQPKQIIDVSNNKVRKLTPKECWRLMGFRDEFIDKCIDYGISNSSLYKQAGNSIVVTVLYFIFRELFKDYIIN